MLEEHEELFSNFKDIHDEYALDAASWQKLFNEYGKEVLEIIRDMNTSCAQRANVASSEILRKSFTEILGRSTELPA